MVAEDSKIPSAPFILTCWYGVCAVSVLVNCDLIKPCYSLLCWNGDFWIVMCQLDSICIRLCSSFGWNNLFFIFWVPFDWKHIITLPTIYKIWGDGGDSRAGTNNPVTPRRATKTPPKHSQLSPNNDMKATWYSIKFWNWIRSRASW